MPELKRRRRAASEPDADSADATQEYSPYVPTFQSARPEDPNAQPTFTNESTWQPDYADDDADIPAPTAEEVFADEALEDPDLYLTEEEQAELLFYHNHQKRENETVICNILKKNNVAIIFGMDKSAHTFLSEQYPEAHFYSQSTPLIDYFSVKSRLGNSKKMYVSIRREAIDIYCFERGHLLLTNSFECTHTEDRIYYLLYVWKQLEFNQERDELHLTGTLPDKETLMSELKKFILQVFIMNPATNIDMQALLTCE